MASAARSGKNVNLLIRLGLSKTSATSDSNAKCQVPSGPVAQKGVIIKAMKDKNASIHLKRARVSTHHKMAQRNCKC